MADSLTPNIRLTNQTEGSNNNTWGTIADTNFETIDNKFGDTTSIETTGGDTTLSNSQEIVAIIDVSGTLVSDSNIIFSGRGGYWIIRNQTEGDFSVTCLVSEQTGVVVDQGTQVLVYCDGTDIVEGNPPPSAVAEETIASAATTNILGAGSEFVAISGTTTITSFGTGTNRKRFVRATGNFTITHNATSLICPGGSNIAAKSGDTFLVVSDDSSNARIHHYQRAGAPPAYLPIGVVLDYTGDTAPDFYIFPYGQNISRTTYAAYFALVGTTYGAGDASTTFGVPDLRGRVVAGKDDMGGTSANRLTNQTGGVNGDTLGDTGGSETHTLTVAQLPSHSHGPGTLAGTTNTTGNHTHSYTRPNAVNAAQTGGGASATINGTGSSTGAAGNHSHTVDISSGTTGTAGSGQAHNIVQPTIVLNKILYVGV